MSFIKYNIFTLWNISGAIDTILKTSWAKASNIFKPFVYSRVMLLISGIWSKNSYLIFSYMSGYFAI